MQPYDGSADPATDARPYNSPPAFYPDQGNASPRDYVAALDAEIALARTFQLNIILTFENYPRWVTGMDSANRDEFGREPNGRRSLENHWPLYGGADSPWANMLRWLMNRYRNDVYWLEIMNEPNLLWWPQRDRAGAEDAACVAASLMDSAMSILRGYGGRPRLLGPTLSDIRAKPPPDDDSLYKSDGLRFVQEIKSRLTAWNFRADKNFGWSHHNYIDLTYDFGENRQPQAGEFGAGKTRAKAMRDVLVNWWTGWPRAETFDPYLLITEGGATLPDLSRIYSIPATDRPLLFAKQAALIQRNWNRMKPANDYQSTDSPGVGMVAAYQLHTDPNFDSGLLDLADNGARRPAFNTWGSLLPPY